MFSYLDYYDLLCAEDKRNIIDPADNQTYYCLISTCNGIPRLNTRTGYIPINVYTKYQAPIYSIGDAKLISFFHIYTFEAIMKNLYDFLTVGLAAVKFTPNSVVIFQNRENRYCATDIQICSIDKTFDRKLLSTESFCRTFIKQSARSIIYARIFTDEMIRYVLKKYSNIFDSTNNKELYNRSLAIKARYKL